MKPNQQESSTPTARRNRQRPPPPPAPSHMMMPRQHLYFDRPSVYSSSSSSFLSPPPPPPRMLSSRMPPLPRPPPPPSSNQQRQRQQLEQLQCTTRNQTNQQPTTTTTKSFQIDPCQMPSVPSATEPNFQPCILFSTTSSTTILSASGCNSISNRSSSSSSSSSSSTNINNSSIPQFTSPEDIPPSVPVPPPSSCSRYIIQDKGNASPRLLQCTTQIVPQNNLVAEKTGMVRLAMGMICMPLAVPSQDYNNVHNDEDDDEFHSCGGDNGLGQNGHVKGSSVEFVPLIWEKEEKGKMDKDGFGERRGVVNPIRCKYCKAYWNPFVRLDKEKDKEKENKNKCDGGYVGYTCNFCEEKNIISMRDDVQEYSNLYTLPLNYGSVEYEVGGEYLCTPQKQRQSGKDTVNDKDDGFVRSDRDRNSGMVHLFALDGGDWDKFLLYLKVLKHVIIKENVKEFWTRQRRLEGEILGDEYGKEVPFQSPKIGFFVYLQNHVIIPYWRKKRTTTIDGINEEYWTLSVSLMTDVEDDPFCPLPLSMWTYSLLDCDKCSMMQQTNIQQTHHSNDEISLSKLIETLERIPTIIRQMIPDYKCRSSNNSAYIPRDCNFWNCGGAALKVLSHALCNGGGGRGTIITSSRLNHGVGALVDRQGNTNTKYINTSVEKSLFTPCQELGSSSVVEENGGSFYTCLAETCVASGVSLNVILCSPLGPESDSGVFEKQFLDLATMGELCRHTCGKLKWLKYEDCDFRLDFSTAVQREGCFAHRLTIQREGCFAHRLKNELLNLLCMFAGQNAFFKMRCSSGVRIVSYVPKSKVPGEVNYAGFSDSPEIILPCVGPDTCIAVELDHRIGGIPMRQMVNGNGTEKVAMLYIQTALLYTNPLGRRRCRVSTLALRATESIPEIYRTANFDTLAAFTMRLAIGDLLDSPSKKTLQMVRQDIVNRCIQILTNYRKFGEIPTAKQGQLILPESLQLLPLFCLSLLKSRLFRPSLPMNPSSTCKPSPTADERTIYLYHCSNICPSMAMLVVHPCVYDLNDLSPNVGELVLMESHSSSRCDFYNNLTSDYSYYDEQQDPLVRATQEPYIQLPPLLKPSVSCIRNGGLYLIDDGFQFFLYVGRNVSLDDRSNKILSIMNSQDDNSSGLRHVSISSSSQFGRRIWNVISQLRKCYSCSIFRNCSRPWYSPVVVILANGGPGYRTVIDSVLEEQLIECLVEDTSNNG
eukprot:CAMPEP_0176495268 /NCGR_PEP_ID=MMETSP0200_2-20121128/10557_1 /TAXON_ID=947934 /ORGANISM="Chaetoceros sp., Strain GSL56" /LENGTH=1213 /DNA_ID=CAMNT_0017893117 /DNA_START=433 /DNA_END=4070 /DNA_ORIENTATION=+